MIGAEHVPGAGEELGEGGDEGRGRERETPMVQAPRRGRHGEKQSSRAEEEEPARRDGDTGCVTAGGGEGRREADGSGCSVAGLPFKERPVVAR